ncbi:hypothetical protein BC828DRAFT_375147 [Blastocladiella britannica]|nr:hypothetical protein BC828DRAFT_375147 [Blastocladiella britannica]
MSHALIGDLAPFVQLGLWFYLPPLAATQLLKAWYSATASSSNVAPGSPQYATHWKRAYAVVIVAYLVYSLADSLASLPPNHYTQLRVAPPVPLPRALAMPPPPDAAFAASVRSQSRALALALHPDKNASPDAAHAFASARDARAVLERPAARVVYDRLGAGMAAFCIASSDRRGGEDDGAATEGSNGLRSECARYAQVLHLYLVHVVMPRYLGWVAVIGLMALFQGVSFGTYWRFVGILAIGTLDVAIATDRLPPMLVDTLAARLWWTPADVAAAAHAVFPALFLALNQLGPVLTTNSDPPLSDAQLAAALHDLAQVVAATHSHVRSSFNTAWAPLRSGGSGSRDLTGPAARRMEMELVELVVAQRDPQYAQARAQVQQQVLAGMP